MLNSVLHRNSLNTLYFSRNGLLPELNPTVLHSHSKTGKRTVRFDEPQLLFRLRRYIFCYSGKHLCKARSESATRGSPDVWFVGPDGYRTCSYCGSIHFDDLLTICSKTITNPNYGVEATSKNYKFYVKQPNVRNACEGATKFYQYHTPLKVTDAEQELFTIALKVTTERFNALQEAKGRIN